MDNLNHALFLAINAGVDPSRPTVWLAVVLAKYVIALVPLHIALVWCFGVPGARRVALTAVLALGLGVLVNQAIGVAAYSPRPFVLGLGHRLIEHRDSSSLPSNHATVMLTYGLVLLRARARALGLATGLLGGAVAWSRIYLGIHFPLDMAAACLTSALAAFAAGAIVRHHGSRLLALMDVVQARALAAGRQALAAGRQAGARLVGRMMPLRGVGQGSWSEARRLHTDAP